MLGLDLFPPRLRTLRRCEYLPQTFSLPNPRHHLPPPLTHTPTWFRTIDLRIPCFSLTLTNLLLCPTPPGCTAFFSWAICSGETNALTYPPPNVSCVPGAAKQGRRPQGGRSTAESDQLLPGWIVLSQRCRVAIPVYSLVCFLRRKGITFPASSASPPVAVPIGTRSPLPSLGHYCPVSSHDRNSSNRRL